MTYLKITNELENHKGLQYNDGLIEDILQFAKEGSCVPGGIYFSNEKNIHNYFSYGVWVREVIIPEDAEIVEDPGGGKWRASKVVLGERKSLSEVSTWEWLVSLGVDFHADNEEALRVASRDGHLELVKYLVSQGADIHVFDNWTFILAYFYGHFEILRFLESCK